MSKAKIPSTFIKSSMQSSRVLHGARNALTYFITNNNNKSLILHPGLRFKSGGWQEDNKKWGLLWTMEGNNTPRMDKGLKQRMVRVATMTGEMVTAIAFE